MLKGNPPKICKNEMRRKFTGNLYCVCAVNAKHLGVTQFEPCGNFLQIFGKIVFREFVTLKTFVLNVVNINRIPLTAGQTCTIFVSKLSKWPFYNPIGVRNLRQSSRRQGRIQGAGGVMPPIWQFTYRKQ